MSVMIGTPLDIAPYIRGVQLVLIGYSGYTKESRYETDKMVRQEIIRTATRVRNHMENILDRQYISGNLEISRIAKLCIEECDYLIEDVSKSSSGMQHAFLSGQRSSSKRDLKELIKHDHDVICMITKAVNLSNSAEICSPIDTERTLELIIQTSRMITSCRGYFSARKNVLAGLKQKKVRR